MNNIEYLRNLYIADLSKQVFYAKNPRSRVSHPGKWAKLPALVELASDVRTPITLSFDDPDRQVWVWSDQHFFHDNIIDFSERPYESVQQMNEHLIANYNEYVGEDDICIWGGDVGFGCTGTINKLLDACNGYKILVIGNHDFNGKKLRKLAFDETYLLYQVHHPDVDLLFTHYPMDNVPEPWYNVHGHLHNYPKIDDGHPAHININCEAQDYRPLLLNDVVKKIKLRQISNELQRKN